MANRRPQTAAQVAADGPTDRRRGAPAGVVQAPGDPSAPLRPLLGQGTICRRTCYPRVLDLAARNGKRVETVPEPIMDEVLARLAAILE